MKWLAEAPSNIALIKYMGRNEDEKKIPANASLSYTLPHLRSFVELEASSETASRWEPLVWDRDGECFIPPLPASGHPLPPGEREREKALPPMQLSEKAQQRFLTHLQYVLDYFSLKQTFIVRSCNNFPQATGLASSASSFAALTLAAIEAACGLTNQPKPSLEVIAQLSRQGSGSSCRSFFSPWALWRDEQVYSVSVAPIYQELSHQVILISTSEKEVSSSEAHTRVKTSPYYSGRAERAESHLDALLAALQSNRWEDMYKATWDDFQDMHRLFETAIPAFKYKTARSEQLLNTLAHYWEQQGDGPLITMDAGPNIHLLYRKDQKEIAQKIEHDYLRGYDYAAAFSA